MAKKQLRVVFTCEIQPCLLSVLEYFVAKLGPFSCITSQYWHPLLFLKQNTYYDHYVLDNVHNNMFS